MKNDALDILYEDNHCLAVMKPARRLTAGDETGDASVLDLAKAYLKRTYDKPGNVYLGLVHRLDRPTSGVLLFARTSKAAGRLSAQFQSGTIGKVYQAIVEGTRSADQLELSDWLLKDRAQNSVRVVAPQTPGAKLCRLGFRTVETTGTRRLLEVRPHTGRSHQIRVQLAARGLPIWGDRKYGSLRRFGGKIALHAGSLSFQHPTKDETITISAPAPSYFREVMQDPD